MYSLLPEKSNPISHHKCIATYPVACIPRNVRNVHMYISCGMYIYMCTWTQTGHKLLQCTMYNVHVYLELL